MSTRTHATTQKTGTGRRPVEAVALVVGVVFLLVGILGFIPGVTTHHDDMMFAGHESMGKLFGLFQVSVLHNLVHLLFGVVGLLASRAVRASRLYLLIGGAVYLVLWVYGLIIDPMSGANFVPLNNPDNWLHLGLGVGMIALGLIFGRTYDRNAPLLDGSAR